MSTPKAQGTQSAAKSEVKTEAPKVPTYIDRKTGKETPVPYYTDKDGNKKLVPINPQTGEPYVWTADQTPLEQYARSLINGAIRDQVFAKCLKHEVAIQQGKLCKALTETQRKQVTEEVSKVVNAMFAKFSL